MKSIHLNPFFRTISGAMVFTLLSLYAPLFLVHIRLFPLVDFIPDIDFCDMQAPSNLDNERCDAALWTILIVHSLFLLALALPVALWATRISRPGSLLSLMVVLLISFWTVFLGSPVAAKFFATGKQAAWMGELDAILLLGGPILCGLAFLTFYFFPGQRQGPGI